MSGDFFQDWFTFALAITIGFGPFTSAIGLAKHFFGNDVEDHPPGCIAAVLVLLVAGFPLAWIVWHNFHVVWR